MLTFEGQKPVFVKDEEDHLLVLLTRSRLEALAGVFQASSAEQVLGECIANGSVHVDAGKRPFLIVSRTVGYTTLHELIDAYKPAGQGTRIGAKSINTVCSRPRCKLVAKYGLAGRKNGIPPLCSKHYQHDLRNRKKKGLA